MYMLYCSYDKSTCQRIVVRGSKGPNSERIGYLYILKPCKEHPRGACAYKPDLAF